MDTTNKVKKAIRLPYDVAQDYSIGSESLWFVPEGINFRLINIPFFLDDLSMEDLVALVKVGEELYEIEKVVEQSGNSTIWITTPNDNEVKDLTKCLHGLGCGIEGGVLEGYYAINVPSNLDIDRVFDVLENEKKSNPIEIFYASDRH